jgi:hypothetical protein
MKKRLSFALFVSLFAVLAVPAQAQQQDQPPPAEAQPAATQAAASPVSSGATQDPPSATSSSARNVSDKPKNDRIFMVIPNYTTVEQPTTITRLTAKQKFKLGALDAFDPYTFPLAAIVAGIAQADNDDAPWGQGLKGYGKRYAAGLADTIDGSFMTTGVFPTLLHEDPRYFRKGTGGFWRRSGYGIKRLFVTRTDSGHSQFNFSEFGGNAAAGAISLTYHSREDRNVSNFLSDWATQITIDFVSNQLKEFWPDMRHKFLHH